MNSNISIRIPVWLDKLIFWPVLMYRLCCFGSPYRKIYLGLGYFTLIDPDDYYRVRSFKWWVHSNGSNLYAARTSITPDLKARIIYLHRQIMNPPAHLVVDHRFGQTLDNRKLNLRVVTHAENMRNRRKQKNTSSKYIGVSLRKNRNSWDANIRINGKKHYLGSFKDELDAAVAYDAAAKKYIGKNVRLNFSDERKNISI